MKKRECYVIISDVYQVKAYTCIRCSAERFASFLVGGKCQIIKTTIDQLKKLGLDSSEDLLYESSEALMITDTIAVEFEAFLEVFISEMVCDFEMFIAYARKFKLSKHEKEMLKYLEKIYDYLFTYAPDMLSGLCMDYDIDYVKIYKYFLLGHVESIMR